MHYKNGREAKNGDKVVSILRYGAPFAGVLHSAVAGNDYCNGTVAVVSIGVNLKDCMHADDVLAASIPDSTKPTTE
jgi:hypothetical protein